VAFCFTFCLQLLSLLREISNCSKNVLEASQHHIGRKNDERTFGHTTWPEHGFLKSPGLTWPRPSKAFWRAARPRWTSRNRGRGWRTGSSARPSGGPERTSRWCWWPSSIAGSTLCGRCSSRRRRRRRWLRFLRPRRWSVAGASSASAWCRQPVRDVSSSYFEK